MGTILTAAKLAKILEISTSAAGAWMPHLDAAMDKYAINSKLRIAAWIAQVGHESGRLKLKEEGLNYSAEGLTKTFGKYFNSKTAADYARQPAKIANRVYGNRMGNGNEASGDGYKFRGRGLIQVTGKENYTACSKGIVINLIDNPDALLTDANAAMSAGWFWSSKGLNNYADRKEFDTTTRRINGGLNGKADRDAIYQRALKVLDDESPDTDKDKAAEVEPDKTTTISKEPTPIAKKQTIQEPAYSGGKSTYPNNIVYESPSGHLVEFDDTPGSERIHVYHRTGAYMVIDATGNFTQKTVIDHTEIIGGDRASQVEGDSTHKVGGQSYTNAEGDVILKSGGTVTIESPDKCQVNAPLLTFDEALEGPTAQFTDMTTVTAQATTVTAATVSAGVVLCGAIFFGMAGGGRASMSDSIDFGSGSGSTSGGGGGSSSGGGSGGGSGNIAEDHVTLKKDVMNEQQVHTKGTASFDQPLVIGAGQQITTGTATAGVRIQGFIDTDNSDKIKICYWDPKEGTSGKWKEIKNDTVYEGPGTTSGGTGGGGTGP